MDQILKAIQDALNDDISAENLYSRDCFKFVTQAGTKTFYQKDGVLYQVSVEVTEVV